MSNVHISNPCKNEVEKYLHIWDESEKDIAKENALTELFCKYPHNDDMTWVLIKAAVLNDFYGTNIYSVFEVAKNILRLNIDERLNAGDESLVDDIACVTMANGFKIRFYSFATKYCSHHQPEYFPIYDSYVEKILCHFRGLDNFAVFLNQDLRDYQTFKNVILQFRSFYGLDDYSVKQIDQYLWLLGKDKMPQYGKKS